MSPPEMDWGEPEEESPLSKSSSKPELWYNRKVSNVTSFQHGRQKGLIGLELEVEGKNLFDTPLQFWTCHSDGSLREVDGHQPQEYVLKQPLDLDEVRQALDYLEGSLKKTKSEPIFSHRTSVHVHFNCQHYTVRQLYCFILLYLIFEEVLVEWSGPERVGNLFCLRARDSDFFVQMLERALKDSTVKGWREDLRYTACNVNSVTKFGSLEFRSLRGTVDKDLIMTWVNLLNCVRLKAQGYDNPVEIVEEFQRLGPLPFFTKVFDKPLQNVLSDVPDLSGKLWSGMRIMRDVAYCCDWVKPAPKKKEEPPEKEQDELIFTAGSAVSTRWGLRPVYVYEGGSTLFLKSYDHMMDIVSQADNVNCAGRRLYYTDDGQGNIYKLKLEEL